MNCRRDCTPHRMIFRLAALVLGSGAVAMAGPLFISAHAQQPRAAAALVLDGVTVVDVEQGKNFTNQRVVVVGTRIQAVDEVSRVPLPKGAQVVDARGKYLIPGLWDFHVHPQRYTDLFYPLFLANGVTGIRDAGSPVPLDTLILWRREILAGTRVGPPRQLLSGRSITQVSTAWCQPSFWKDLQYCVADSTAARRLIDSLKAAGADLIKTYSGLSKTTYVAMAAEARRLSIPFGGHLDAMTAVEASDSGARILDHLGRVVGLDKFCLPETTDYDWGDGGRGHHGTIEQCRPVAERFQRNSTWWVPTLIVGATGRPATRYASILTQFKAYAHAFWSDSVRPPYTLPNPLGSDSVGTAAAHTSRPGRTQRPRLPGDSLGFMHIVQATSLPLLAGTDASHADLLEMPPGFSLHAELAAYVAGGMTPLAALQTATLNPAKFLHGTDSLGSIASEKLADLVLLDGDPFTDITNTTRIRAVVANGRYYDRAALDRVLTEVQVKARADTALQARRPKARRSRGTP